MEIKQAVPLRRKISFQDLRGILKVGNPCLVITKGTSKTNHSILMSMSQSTVVRVQRARCWIRLGFEKISVRQYQFQRMARKINQRSQDFISKDLH